MLFGMGARKHFTALSLTGNWIAAIVVLLVGVGIAVHVVKHVSPKVGREFVK